MVSRLYMGLKELIAYNEMLKLMESNKKLKPPPLKSYKKGEMRPYHFQQGLIMALTKKLANKQAKKLGWIDRY